jgi:hypothetical protein
MRAVAIATASRLLGRALPGDDLHVLVDAEAAGIDAAPEVGSTWFVPDALSPKATVVSSPRNSEP